MSRARVLWIAGAVVVIAVVAIGLATATKSSGPKPSAAPSQAAAAKALAGSPPALAKLHRQSNQLLPGGLSAFEKQLASLKGHPVVVNKWASWCGPCREEFPEFQQAAIEHGKRIAFVGVNSNDNDAAAKRFLAKFPVSYPSYEDGNGAIAQKMEAAGAFPTTVFYDASGKRVAQHIGVYRDRAQLEADIRKYAQ